MIRPILLAAAILASTAVPAFAHFAPGAHHHSFLAGFSHPLFGIDHVLAMVTVGLWAALLGGRAVWLAPSAFLTAMALGFAAALAGLPVPFVEPVILASVITLGLIVAIALPVSPLAGMIVVGLFAFFHGHAHGTELAASAAIPYGAGFMIATALLHAAGVGFGVALRGLIRGEQGALAIRAVGAAVALGGAALTFMG